MSKLPEGALVWKAMAERAHKKRLASKPKAYWAYGPSAQRERRPEGRPLKQYPNGKKGFAA
jgi:hypothetical protein